MSTILTVLAVLAAGTPGLLLSPTELLAALKDPATVVIAVGSSEDEFVAGHIPNARFVRYDEIAIDVDNLGSELPPVDQLRKLLSAAGISNSSKVVIYGSPIAATRMFFTLDYLGHPSARVLNGGLNAWKASGGAIEIGVQKRGAAAALNPKPNPSRVVTAEWITPRLSSPKITLLDARPDSEFSAGHLPDAHQLVFNTLLDASGKFLPDAELKKKLDAIGAKADTPLVSYCMVGMRASVTYFVSRHLGYDARLYDGSIIDWTRRNLPVVKGK